MVNLMIKDLQPQTKTFDMGGVTVTAVDRIPYEKKMECAAFIAVRTRFESQDKGIALSAADESVIVMQAKLMFYTDANMEGMSKETLYRLFDMLAGTTEYNDFCEYIWRDYTHTVDALFVMQDAIVRRIEQNSNALMPMLGAFLSDPQPEKTIAEGRAVNEFLIDLLGKAQKYDAQVAAVRGGIHGNLKNGAVSYAKKD